MASIPATQGFLVVDKPPGLTSRDVVDHVQQWFPRMKLGHAGTLDPAATGVLVIAVGSVATRFVEFVQDQEKTYLTTVCLGATSTTDDADGEITSTGSIVPPEKEAVLKALTLFHGQISQTPPAYSAARIDGERAHTRARRGEKVILKPRTVTVHEITMLRYAYPELELQIRCSKGTYIRSIARDLGDHLLTGGFVQSLRRTRIGTLTGEQAIPWDASQEVARQALLPLSIAVQHLPRCNFTADETRRLQQGQPMACQLTLAESHVGLWNDNQLFGVGSFDAARQLIRPVKIISYSTE